MKVIYQDLASLRDIKEPYRSALAILQDMSVEVPGQLEPLSSALPMNMAINAVQVICEAVQENLVAYVPTIRNEMGKIFRGTNVRINRFDSFNVPSSRELACIMGAAYYVLAVSGILDEHQLGQMAKIVIGYNNKIINPGYFNVFVEKAKEAGQREGAAAKDVVAANQSAADGRRIVLASRRNSDFVRIVQAMVSGGYFTHADKSAVTATEVGQMMLSLFGSNNEWKTMLQRAFSCDNPLKTFDNLRDAAQEYWTKREDLNT